MMETDKRFEIWRKIYIWKQWKWQHTALSQYYLSRNLQLWHLGGITNTQKEPAVMVYKILASMTDKLEA